MNTTSSKGLFRNAIADLDYQHQQKVLGNLDPVEVHSSSTQVDEDDDTHLEAIDPCKGYIHTIFHPTHGCQVNPHTRQAFCNFLDLRIDTSLIKQDQGGEPLETVMGRTESAEFQKYSKGAFSVRRQPDLEESLKQNANLYYMTDVLGSLVYPTEMNKGGFNSYCAETRPGTTLMITRYEYANLYHTVTDWWNAFAVLTAEQVQRKEKVNILFLDGHAEGNLDPIWEDIFGRYEYVKHLLADGVCFERAVFIPARYSGPLFPSSRKRYPKRQSARAFSDSVVKTYGLQDIKPIHGTVVIIDRQPYISHPQSVQDTFQRGMNLDDLVQRLRNDSKATSVEIVRFETLPYGEQLRTVRQAYVLIGNHGAGISNLLFMDESSHVLEFNAKGMYFFAYMARWKDTHFHSQRIQNEGHLSDHDLSNAVSIINEWVG